MTATNKRFSYAFKCNSGERKKKSITGIKIPNGALDDPSNED